MNIRALGGEFSNRSWVEFALSAFSHEQL
jgi:hypothetical protein